jgi:hypothetical protein
MGGLGHEDRIACQGDWVQQKIRTRQNDEKIGVKFYAPKKWAVIVGSIAGGAWENFVSYCY